MQITATTTNPQAGLRVMPQVMPAGEGEYRVRAMPKPLRPPTSPERAKGVLVLVLAILIIGGLIGSVAYLFLTKPDLAGLQNQIKGQASSIEAINKDLLDQKGRLDLIEERLAALPSQEEFITFKTDLDELKKRIIGLADTDQDGIPDSWEEKYGLNPKDRRDTLLDPDGDDLINLYEYHLDTDPKNKDTDGDGYLDGQEVEHGYNPKGEGKLEGILKVELPTLIEEEPLEVKDTDKDGLPDDWEKQYGLKPDDPRDAQEDPDKDGLINLNEHVYRTDPTKEDTDEDGYLDGQEVEHGYNPKGAGRLEALEELKEKAEAIKKKAEEAAKPILERAEEETPQAAEKSLEKAEEELKTEAKEKANVSARVGRLMGFRAAKNYKASLEYLTPEAEKNYKPEVIVGKTDLTWKPEVLDNQIEKKENDYIIKVKIKEYSGDITKGTLVDSFEETQTWIKQNDTWLLDKIEGNKYQIK